MSSRHRLLFADLLHEAQFGAEETRDTAPIDARAVRLARVIEASLEAQGIADERRHLGACVRACEAAIDEWFGGDPTNPATRDAPPVASGDLSRVHVDQVLQLASNLGEPACCRVEDGRRAIEVFLDGARMRFARHENLRDGYLFGRILAATGKVDEIAIERAVRTNHRASTWIGQRLIEAGLIDGATVGEVLAAQAEELAFEALAWRRGRFSIHADLPLPSEVTDACVEVPLHQVLLEGARRLDEWSRMTADLGALETIPRRARRSEFDRVADELPPDERNVLARVDGCLTIDQIIGHARRPAFSVVRALHRLVCRRLVVVGPAPGAPP